MDETFGGSLAQSFNIKDLLIVASFAAAIAAFAGRFFFGRKGLIVFPLIVLLLLGAACLVRQANSNQRSASNGEGAPAASRHQHGTS